MQDMLSCIGVQYSFTHYAGLASGQTRPSADVCDNYQTIVENNIRQ
jgi:hypothetical protein